MGGGNLMKKGNNWRTAVIVIITIADIIYQLIPIDLVPDAVPVLGQIDDSIGVIINILAAIRLQAGKYKKTLDDQTNAS